MPNPTVPAAATGLPTRRRAFAALAGLGAALSLPGVAKATAALAANPDADLIASATEVEAMAVRFWAALTRYGDLREKVDELTGWEPRKPETPDKFDISVERHQEGGFVMKNTAKPDIAAIEARYAAALEQHAAALEVWNADRDRIERRIGFRAADRLYTRLYARLKTATLDLTAMEPATLAGVAAKARAMVAIDPDDDDSLNEWEAALKTAVLHDVVRIGGAA